VLARKTPLRTPEQLKRHRDHMRMCRLRDPEKFRSRVREYGQRPESRVKRKQYDKTRRIERLVAEAKKRAKQRGLAFTISPHDILIPLLCPALGIPIIWGGPRHNWPSIDRFDNSKGYTPDNIRVISFRANNLKSDATAEEAERIAVYMSGGT
jgi:hypothetical protein